MPPWVRLYRYRSTKPLRVPALRVTIRHPDFQGLPYKVQWFLLVGMENAPPEEKWEVTDVMLALHRANRNWPNRQDIYKYWNRNRSFPSFDSPERAEIAVAALHKDEQQARAVGEISDALRADAIAGFISRYAQSASDLDKSKISYYIQQLMDQGRYAAIETLLNDIAERGSVKALSSHRNVGRGSKLGHAWNIFTALLEIAVVLVAISGCDHGFQRIVVASLGLIYSTVVYRQMAIANLALSSFAAQYEWMTRLLRLLKDKSLTAEQTEEEMVSLRKGLSKNQVAYWIHATKLTILFFICLVVLVMNAM